MHHTNLSKLTACGNEAMACIEKAGWKEYKIWLFVSAKFVQPSVQDEKLRDRRIAEYKNVWKNRHAIGVCESLKSQQDVAIESNGFIYFCALCEISSSLVGAAINAVRTSPSFAMILSKRADIGARKAYDRFSFPLLKRITRLTNHASIGKVGAGFMWSRPRHACSCNGLFDDQEAAVDIIAAKRNHSGRRKGDTVD